MCTLGHLRTLGTIKEISTFNIAFQHGKYMGVWVLLFCLFINVSYTADSDVHTLEVQYTVLPGPTEQLQFHQTTINDGQILFYCNSSSLIDTPRQDWIYHVFTPGELKGRNAYCKEQLTDHVAWFYEISATIKDTTEIFQRRCSCQASGSNVSCLDKWGINGEDFLTFEPQTLQWTPDTNLAAPVAQKWNQQTVRNHFSKNHMEATSHNINKALKQKREIEMSTNADKDINVNIFVKPTPRWTSMVCHTTASDLSGVRIQIKKDGVPLGSSLKLTGPLPNGDGTVQMRLHVQVRLETTDRYQCQVLKGGHTLSVYWDGLSLDSKVIVPPKSPSQVDVKAVVFGIVVCLVAVGLFIRHIIWKRSQSQILINADNEGRHLRYCQTQEDFDEWMVVDDEFYLPT